MFDDDFLLLGFSNPVPVDTARVAEARIIRDVDGAVLDFPERLEAQDLEARLEDLERGAAAVEPAAVDNAQVLEDAEAAELLVVRLDLHKVRNLLDRFQDGQLRHFHRPDLIVLVACEGDLKNLNAAVDNGTSLVLVYVSRMDKTVVINLDSTRFWTWSFALHAFSLLACSPANPTIFDAGTFVGDKVSWAFVHTEATVGIFRVGIEHLAVLTRTVYELRRTEIFTHSFVLKVLARPTIRLRWTRTSTSTFRMAALVRKEAKAATVALRTARNARQLLTIFRSIAPAVPVSIEFTAFVALTALSPVVFFVV